MDQNYKLILVDDEDDVRGRILSKIKEESGFTVVGKAGNGFDAIDLIEKHKPHVVLTDIKMPFINGIELARIIRRDYPTTKVAFISGYDEFDYAREAIELNVVSYLMKPVTSEDIDAFLTKLRSILDKEFEFLSNSNIIHQRYQDSIPMLINSYLSTYRYKNTLSSEDISHLEQYNLRLEDSQYVVAIIGFDNDQILKSTEETKIFISNLTKKVFKKYDSIHQFLVPKGVVVLLKEPSINRSRLIDIELYEIVQYAEEFRKTTLEIGVSSVFASFDQYPLAYRQAEQSLRHSKYFNLGQIIYYDDIEEKETKFVLIDETKLSEFEYLLKFGKKPEIKEQIDLILNLAFDQHHDVIIDPQLLIIKIANALINYASSINVNISEVHQGNLVDSLTAFHDMDDLKDFIYELIINLRENNVKTQVDKTEQIIDAFYQYIQQNYQDPNVSLDTVTDHLNISVSYLSMLLKKMKGVSFHKELIRYRMEKAMELLKFTKEKIIIIARMVGYNEVYYFSHSFKKFTGMSPMEFRKHA
jgi:two-component system response regulator YesN